MPKSKTSNSGYVLDASALLALLQKEPSHERVEECIPYSVMSAVNIGEVAQTLAARDVPRKDIIATVTRLIPDIRPFDAAQAWSTAWLREKTKKFGISFGDRACLSLGQLTGHRVITADREWKQLNIGIEIEVIR